MKVWHIYVMNENFGDHVLGEGLKNLLTQGLDIPRHSIESYNIFQIDWNNPSLVNLINSKVDLVVIGGGGLISGNGGFYFRMNKDLIQRIKTPLLFYSIGYNLFRGEPDFNQAQGEILRESINHSIFFSARRDGSMEKLRDLGFHIKNSPDPGFWIKKKYLKLFNKPYVILNVAGDVHRYRYYEGNHISFFTFMDRIQEIVKFLLEKKYKVLFALHRMDDLIVKDLPKVSKDIYLWDWRNILTNTDIGLSYYQYAHSVIGMRGHSQIIPIGLGVPAISLGQQDKNLGLMTKLELQKYNVEISDPDLVNKVKDLFEDLEQNREKVKELYKKKLTNWKKEVRTEFQEIKKKLEKP